MKIKITAFAVTALFLLTGQFAFARILQGVTPEELFERAEVVFIGTVLQIEETGLKGEKKRGEREPIPTKQYKAVIQVEQVKKGTAPKRINMLYFSTDWDRLGTLHVMINGPWEIQLLEGNRYKFYLKRSSTDGESYIGVLDGEFDDGSAVVKVKE